MEEGADSPLKLDAEKAATRIQAVHRGNDARNRVAGLNGAADGEGAPPDQASAEAPGGEPAAAPPTEAPSGEAPADPPSETPAEAPSVEAPTVAAPAVEASAAAAPAAATPPPPTAITPEALQEPEDVPGAVEAAAAALADGTLAGVYKQAAEAAGCQANYLVVRSLLESSKAGKGSLFIEAPGSHALTFSSRLGDKDMRLFATVFRGCAPLLTRLDLANNLVTDAGASALASGLLGPRAERLEALSLRSNSVGPQGCQALCQALRGCPVLRSLDLSGNPLGRPGGLAVVELLKAAPGLEELRLADAELDIDVLVAVAAALLQCGSRLRLCDLENPRIQTLQEEHTVHLGRMLRVNTHLSEVRLGKHRMRDEGVRQLVSFLVENKTLRVLDLRCNELGADGARHLGTLLRDDCQLSLLNLSGNRIGEKQNVAGARALAEALQANRMLRALDLNNNELCGEALQLLADALDRNSTLETLALFHNQWDQPSSYKFHQILHDRRRILPLCADFVTSQVDLRIDICKVDGFELR